MKNFTLSTEHLLSSKRFPIIGFCLETYFTARNDTAAVRSLFVERMEEEGRAKDVGWMASMASRGGSFLIFIEVFPAGALRHVW